MSKNANIGLLLFSLGKVGSVLDMIQEAENYTLIGLNEQDIRI
jgi:hypothetical protein